MESQQLWTLAQHVWSTGAGELIRIHTYMDTDVMSRCVDLIRDCSGRIVTSGCGTSAMAAKKIAHSLSCIERPSFFLAPSDAVHGALGSVQPNDVAILISKGGGTSEIVAMLPAFAAKGVPIIAVTENPESILGGAATVVVPIKVKREADEFNMLATTSTMVVIAWFDAVCIGLMREMEYTREQFGIIHPGGAVGDRLRDTGSGPTG